MNEIHVEYCKYLSESKELPKEMRRRGVFYVGSHAFGQRIEIHVDGTVEVPERNGSLLSKLFKQGRTRRVSLENPGELLYFLERNEKGEKSHNSRPVNLDYISLSELKVLNEAIVMGRKNLEPYNKCIEGIE